MESTSTDAYDKDPSRKKKLNNELEHSECLRILNLVMDGEATHEQREYFKSHIENCMPYYEIYNVDKTIKELIKRNCCNHPVPADLVETIRAKILEGAE